MLEFVTAQTEYGQVRGEKTKTVLGEEYVRFLGIPYAEKPIGKLRFKEPQKPSKWTEILDTTKEESPCASIRENSKDIIGSEDCLYLNVYTKDVHPKKPYPVIVFIHGGGYTQGSSELFRYSPDYLLIADVIVVTFNYRLGAFGFLCLNDKELNVPGNAGIKDQRMLLMFVQDNILNFGGDPENVTLLGHSAGAGCVHAHCLSDLSKNLFKRAVIMSGHLLAPYLIMAELDQLVRLVKALGYDGDESNESNMLNYLQSVDPFKIVVAQMKLIKPDELRQTLVPFAPTIESYETSNVIISKPPVELLETAWSNDIDIMIGGTADEGYGFLNIIKAVSSFLTSFKLEHTLPDGPKNLSDNDPILKRIVEKLEQTYYLSSKEDVTKDKLALCKIIGDRHIWHGLHRLVQGRQNSSGIGKTFLYRFAVDSPTQNYHKISRYGKDLRGVCHADELSYLFKCSHVDDPIDPSSVEYKSIRRFVSIFTSFAATGDPNSNIIGADMQDVTFESVDTKVPPFKCLNIEENLTFEDLPETQRMKVWNEIFEAINVKLY